MKTFTVAINLALLHVALAGSVGKWARVLHTDSASECNLNCENNINVGYAQCLTRCLENTDCTGSIWDTAGWCCEKAPLTCSTSEKDITSYTLPGLCTDAGATVGNQAPVQNQIDQSNCMNLSCATTSFCTNHLQPCGSANNAVCDTDKFLCTDETDGICVLKPSTELRRRRRSRARLEALAKRQR